MAVPTVWNFDKCRDTAPLKQRQKIKESETQHGIAVKGVAI